MTAYHLPNTDLFDKNINGKKSHLFTLQNRAGMQIALTDYGARLVSALVPDNKGNLIDVVLGFSSIEGYLDAKEKYHGATIGRVSNRIANGKFNLNGKEYILNQNNDTNNLHGGPQGFHTKLWDRQRSYSNRIDFYYVSADEEEGFPGEVKVNVSYELTNNNGIIIKYKAHSNKDTILNLTNHTYFNLNGEGNGTIIDHTLQIKSNYYLPIDDKQIPIGTIEPTKDTIFDFNQPKNIGQSLVLNEEQIRLANGLDHSFVNDTPISSPIASVESLETGIKLEALTDLPTIHLYTGNYLADDIGKSGKSYEKYGGFCLEAQHYIDSPNQKSFPPIELKANQEYNASIIYRFSIVK